MPKKTYTLYRGGEPIKIEKEEEFFTAIIPDRKAIIELVNHSEVKQMKRVFNNIYKIKTTKGEQSSLMNKIRSNQHSQTIAHHAYTPLGDKITRYYITDKIIIAFQKRTNPDKVATIFEKHGLQYLKEYNTPLPSYLVQVTKSTGMNPVKVTNLLMEYPEVISAEPNLVNRFMNFHTPKDSLYKSQWHLNSKKGVHLVANAGVNAPKAWDTTKGARKVVVAIIDDGFDMDHPDLKGDGKKIVHPRDFVDGDDDPTPTKARDDYHGTPCAGVAIGEENGKGIVGVAPKCSFMPIRFDLAADDNLLWEIFDHAGKYADVISCSWGPVPVYAPLSQLLKDKFEELTKKGGPRKKGCVICFAAGNYNAPIYDMGNESFDWLHPGGVIFNTPGPIINGNCFHPDVIAVSASTSLGKKAAYSNWGKHISVAAPSNNWNPIDSQEFVPGRGIWTTDNEKNGTGFTANSQYTGSFGGTSSATPLVAGIAALIISANPSLTAKQVRAILESTTDKIEDKEPDIVLKNKKGTYNSKGHSEWFGYGKVNAAKAVAKAKSMKKTTTTKPKTTTTSTKSVSKGLFILSAMVNPKGKESGNETVALLNATSETVNLKDWILGDGKRKKQILSFSLKAGEIKIVKLTSKFRLTNSGGNIVLHNKEKQIVHQVSYSKKEASKEGWTVKF